MSRKISRAPGRFRFSIVLTLMMAFVFSVSLRSGEAMAVNKKKIVYIEASTGKAWKLDQFPERVGARNIEIEFIPLYQFDKSDAVNKVLRDRKTKPSVVILQECSVYFPGPMDVYKRQYQGWLSDLKNAGITPVVATTVPPAELRGLVSGVKEFIKLHMLGRPSQYDQIADFNDWLRDLAKSERIEILDLERSIRRDTTDRRMKDEYNAGDGTHLNDAAYKVLDRDLLDVLSRVK